MVDALLYFGILAAFIGGYAFGFKRTCWACWWKGYDARIKELTPKRDAHGRFLKHEE